MLFESISYPRCSSFCCTCEITDHHALQIIQRTLIMRGEKGTVQKIRKKSQQLALLFLRRKPFQLCIRLCIQLSLSCSFSFLERCGSKNVSLSLFSCTNNLDDGHEKTRSSVVKVKIVFRRLRKKDLYVIHTYYLLLLCIFFLYYFLSGTRQSAKNSFHIIPDNKHTHAVHKFTQWVVGLHTT